MSTIMFWTAFAGFLVTTIAATAELVLNEIAWHELEEYSKQRKQPSRFGRIFERRDSMLLGCGILHMVATAIMAIAMVSWCFAGHDPASLGLKDYGSAFLVLGFALVLSGSWIPWAVARVGSVPFLFHSWRLWWVASLVVWPLAAGGSVVGDLLARASGVEEPSDEEEEEAFEDEILSMVSEGEHDGFLEADAREMIEGVMELDDYDVSHVMTPRTGVDALDVSTSREEMIEFVISSGRTRIPIYEESIDNVIGLLYAKDLLRESIEPQRQELRKLLRDPIIVPTSMKLDEMLKLFLHGRTHMAIVMDEYDGTAGVVTIEDVLEEIVGEIVDETDKDKGGDIEVLNESQADVFGTVHIERLNQELGIELPDEDEFATVSGLIMSQLKEVPRSGQEVTIGNVQFNILEASRRKIDSVRVTLINRDDEEA
ncbi:MAG: hemolysin family protein [Planctomycetota bacterium]